LSKGRLFACDAEIDSELSAQQWQLAEKVAKVLKPFEEAIVAVSSEGASAVLIIVNSLTHFLMEDDVEGVQMMNRKMLSSLNTHFASMETNKLYVLPTMLDP